MFASQFENKRQEKNHEQKHLCIYGTYFVPVSYAIVSSVFNFRLIYCIRHIIVFATIYSELKKSIYVFVFYVIRQLLYSHVLYFLFFKRWFQ